jgi:hypothetical protein
LSFFAVSVFREKVSAQTTLEKLRWWIFSRNYSFNSQRRMCERTFNEILAREELACGKRREKRKFFHPFANIFHFPNQKLKFCVSVVTKKGKGKCEIDNNFRCE